jgi:hypothetical protein
MRTKKNPHSTGISDEGIALDEPVVARACAAPPKLDDWQSRHRTRRLGRELRRSSPGAPVASPLERLPNNPRRFDPPADLFDRTPVPTPTYSPTSNSSAPRRSKGGQAIAWFLVMTGLAALSGGLGGGAWSLATNRGEYWNAFVGLMLGGQGALIFGLVLAVSRLWRSSRFAAGKLQDVHARLGELQRMAETLAAQRGSAPAFYADLARSAPPQMLVANLKGQLDQLAARFGG